MALTGLTKIGGSSLEQPLSLDGGLHVAGVSTFANQIIGHQGLAVGHVGIMSGGIGIATDVPLSMLNFVGIGNTFLYHTGGQCDISISGGGGGGGVATVDSLDKVAFIHFGGFTANAQIKSPQKFSDIFTHVDATVDIEDGVTVDIDEDCLLRIIDKDDYDINYFAPTDAHDHLYPQTNVLRDTGFDDTIRTTFETNGELNTRKKVGYVKLPKDLEDEIMIDIESGVTIDVGDQCVLII